MSQKTTNQPGSNDQQPHEERTRNHEAHDTSFTRPNGEREFLTSDKSVQREEEDHVSHGKTKAELQEERGGHGHSGHSSNRKGSRK